LETTLLWPLRVKTSCPRSASQIFTSPFPVPPSGYAPAEARRLPSGLKQTLLTSVVWPWRVRRVVPGGGPGSLLGGGGGGGAGLPPVTGVGSLGAVLPAGPSRRDGSSCLSREDSRVTGWPRSVIRSAWGSFRSLVLPALSLKTSPSPVPITPPSSRAAPATTSRRPARPPATRSR